MRREEKGKKGRKYIYTYRERERETTCVCVCKEKGEVFGGKY